MSEVLTRPPTELAIGETVEYRIEAAGFSPVDGWAVSYFFRGPSEVDLVGVADGAGFVFNVVGGSFAAAGGYEWEAVAVHAGDSERCRIASGRIEIVADLEAATGLGDQSTHNRRMLAALESVLEGTATAGNRSYTIAGRSIERMSLDELVKARDLYARRVAAEDELAAAGLSRAPRRVLSVLR